jgi:hypothetical protein
MILSARIATRTSRAEINGELPANLVDRPENLDLRQPAICFRILRHAFAPEMFFGRNFETFLKRVARAKTCPVQVFYA